MAVQDLTRNFNIETVKPQEIPIKVCAITILSYIVRLVMSRLWKSRANQLTGFYMMATLVVKELMVEGLFSLEGGLVVIGCRQSKSFI